MAISELQRKIISHLRTQASIDVDNEIRERVDFIKRYLQYTGCKSLVLGLSGGIDSTTAGKLAQIAVDELNDENGRDHYQFVAMRLPYYSQVDEADAQSAIEAIKPSRLATVNVAPIVLGADQACSDFVHVSGCSEEAVDFARGNIKARARMLIQYYQASLSNGLVIGTDHSAEAITGFYTKFGDGACDLAPLFGLSKRQVRALASALGVPSHLVYKTPTADLEDMNPQQPDEASLGVTYDEIDDFLEGKEIAVSSAKFLEERYVKTEHKRQLPVTLYDTWYNEG